MKFCMIGCGGHASTSHGPAQRLSAARHPDLLLAACCDHDADRAAAYREAFGFARHYTDVETMLAAEKPDALCLTIPTHLMAAAAEPLLERGIPLLLEKPPGMNGVELERLIAAAEHGAGIHQVAFNRRFMPILVRAREELDRTLPPEAVLDIEYSLYRNARTEPDFSTTAIHAFDAALFLARSPYRRARFSHRPMPHLGEGVVQTVVEAEFVSGTRIRLNIFPLSGLNAERIALHGVGDSFFITLFEETLVHWKEGKEVLALAAHDDPSLHGMGIAEETEAFIAAVREGIACRPTLAEARQPIALMEAMKARVAELVFE